MIALGLGLDYWNGGMSDTEQTDGMVSEETMDAAKEKAEEAGDAVREASESAAEAVKGE